MTTKIKTIFLTTFFVFALTALHAQTKYHFARVAVHIVNDKQIIVITDHEPDRVIDIDKGMVKIKKLLQVVSEMTADGWEVINAKEGELVITYFLKKKAN